MKKIILMGRSECGKTTLSQALRGETITYHKTQYINHFDVIIDTGENISKQKHLAMHWHYMPMKPTLEVFCSQQQNPILFIRRTLRVW